MMFKLTSSITRTLPKRLTTTKTAFNTNRNLNVVARPSDLIGNTPLIDLSGILQKHGVDGMYDYKYLFSNSISIFISH